MSLWSSVYKPVSHSKLLLREGETQGLGSVLSAWGLSQYLEWQGVFAE